MRDSMKKKLIFAIILLIIAMGTVSASNSNTKLHATCDEIIINTTHSDFDDDPLKLGSNQEDSLLSEKNSNAGTFTELQNKINSAKKGSTITLTKDYHYNNYFSSKNGIKITKPITIDGNGHAIDGLKKSPLLLVLNTKNVVLKNIVFKNGNIEDVGSIGVFYSNNVKFNNCQFIDNYAHDGGTVFLAYSNYSSFVACEFKNNLAEYGSAAYLDHSTSSFDSCNFYDNWAYYDGGAIYLDYSSSSFNSCNFYDNWAQHNGGAICPFQSALNFLNTEFNANTADIAGGDIYSQYSMIYLQDSTFYNSTSSGFGGSLSFYNDYVQIRNCCFEECESFDDGGGAIYSLNSILNCYFSEFNKCYAYYGGALCSLNTALNIKNNNFDTNRAYYVGGSIYTLYGSITVDSSNFTYSSSKRGGAMYIRSPNKINNITNNRFLYCFANTGQIIYIDSYYGEIPESGNIYEDIYFVYGNITLELNGKKHSNYSNTLA